MFEKYPRYLQLAPTDETGTVQNTSNQRWKMATSGEETTGIFSNDPRWKMWIPNVLPRYKQIKFESYKSIRVMSFFMIPLDDVGGFASYFGMMV